MSILTVITAADTPQFASLDELKTELGITTDDHDDYLTGVLQQASASIEVYLDRVIGVETVNEVFRGNELPEADQVILSRYPVASVTSVAVDGTAVTSYDFDANKGFLYSLDADGDLDYWCASNKITVVYQAGYSVAPLPIQRACLEIAKGKWYSQQRDPFLKAETIPGVIEQQFWVGQVGSEINGIPSGIASSIDTYRNLGGAL